MNSKLMEYVYYSMIGALISPMKGIENAFESGNLCAKCYADVYEAKIRLLERLGKDSEDEDVEIIINSLLTIQRELCCRMYKYGAKFGPSNT